MIIKLFNRFLIFIIIILAAQAFSAEDKAEITVLYDAFGKRPGLEKDWGFSAFIEYGGKRILFDTGNDAEIFEHNVNAIGADLTDLDFVIISHRHGDHTSGLGYLLEVNPDVTVYVPKEIAGVFGGSIPGSFYKTDKSLPREMRYFDGHQPETLNIGSPWPEGNFNLISETVEIAPGFYLILLKGDWGVDVELMELSLAIDTPEGIVLIVGCSHPTLEKIILIAKSLIDKPVHLVFGGTHLLPANDEELTQIADSLQNELGVSWIAPAHCTGEPAFKALKQQFGERYLYSGLGETLILGPKINVKTNQPEPATETK